MDYPQYTWSAGLLPDLDAAVARGKIDCDRGAEGDQRRAPTWRDSVSEFWSLVLSGLVTGAIYSIMASGLVLTFSTSGIFNFAHAAIAFATAYLYYQLNTGLGVPIVPSVIICAFIFAPLLGLALDRILLRRLATAPLYARIVGTIGLLVALPAFVQWLVVTVGNGVLDLGFIGNGAITDGVPVPGVGPTPQHTYKPFLGVVLNSDQ